MDMREGLWDGLNVTMPLKGDAAALVDELTETAQRSGSVNTISADGSHLVGHTTDADATAQLMGSERFAATRAVLVLGSGGSARAVMAGIPSRFDRYVSARDPDKAADLAGRGSTVPWGDGVRGAVVVNCTPLGMAGELLPEPVLGNAYGLIDLPYGRDDTPSVRAARGQGIPVADGREFLLRQALASFSVWTGVHIDFEAVSEDLKNV